MDKKQIKEVYTQIVDICNKHIHTEDFKKTYGIDDLKDFHDRAMNHLTVFEWEEKYGIRLNQSERPYTLRHFNYGTHGSFSRFKYAAKDKAQGYGRYISNSVKQPENEWLFSISFPTGPYIFGKDYDGQKKIYQEMIKEIESYNPDFRDSINHYYYWKLENAKNIFNDFSKILQKYREKNREDIPKRKKERLLKELEELENTDAVV